LQISHGGPPAQNYFIERDQPQDDAKLAHFSPPLLAEKKFSRRHWYAPDEYFYAEIAQGAAQVQRAGGLLGVGAHGEVPGFGTHWEMQAYAAGGMTPHEVLRAATIGSAETIGRQDEIGSLAPGKYADLVILEKNPLDDIRNTLAIAQVMKNGRLYDAGTLDEVWPEHKPLAQQWFSRERKIELPRRSDDMAAGMQLLPARGNDFNNGNTLVPEPNRSFVMRHMKKLLIAALLAVVPASGALADPEKMIEIYHIAPGKQVQFLKLIALYDQANLEAGLPARELYVHSDGASWDFLLIQDEDVEPAKAKVRNEALKNSARRPARNSGSRSAKTIAEHTDTVATGPTTAGDWSEETRRLRQSPEIAFAFSACIRYPKGFV
jgi:hypothetical protein